MVEKNFLWKRNVWFLILRKINDRSSDSERGVKDVKELRSERNSLRIIGEGYFSRWKRAKRMKRGCWEFSYEEVACSQKELGLLAFYGLTDSMGWNCQQLISVLTPRSTDIFIIFDRINRIERRFAKCIQLRAFSQSRQLIFVDALTRVLPIKTDRTILAKIIFKRNCEIKRKTFRIFPIYR